MKFPHPSYTAVLAGFSLLFLCGVAYAYGVAMPAIRETFALSKTLASLPFSTILVFYTLGMWLGGVIQDRLGPTRACLGGAVLFGLGFALSGWMPNLWLLLLTYGVCCGFGIGVSYVAAVATAVRWFPQRRGLAAGCVVLGFGLGSLVLAPLKHFLIAQMGWRPTFLLMGAVFLVCGWLLANLIRPPQQASTGAMDDSGDPGIDSLTTQQMIRSPRFWCVWLGWSFAMCAALGWMGHLASMVELADLASATGAWVLSTVALTNGLSRPLVGALADRAGRLPTLLGACFLFVLLAGLMLLPLEGAWRFFCFGALFGACFGALLVNYSPLAVEFFGLWHLGSNLGLLFTSYGVGALSGPALFGWLFDRSGSYDTAIQFSIVLLIIALVLFHFASPRRQRFPAPQQG